MRCVPLVGIMLLLLLFTSAACCWGRLLFLLSSIARDDEARREELAVRGITILPTLCPIRHTWELLLHAGQMGVPSWNALNGVHTNTCASETAVDAFRVGGRVLYINDKGSVEET